MNIKRYIAGLLLVCFSVFLGHNLVPHHHHSEVFQSPVASDCPFEHDNHQGHDHESDADLDAEEHPIHCHAFNDVVFEKYTSSTVKPWSIQLQTLFALGKSLVPEVPLVEISSHILSLKPPFDSHTLVGSRTLRGPPAFV
jgi:hypothetical protein